MDLSHLKQTLPPDWLSLNIERKPTPIWMPMPIPMWMPMPMPIQMLMPCNNESYLTSDQNNEPVAASSSKRNYSIRLPQRDEDNSVKKKVKVKKQKKIKTEEKKIKKKIGPIVTLSATARERIELLGGNHIELFIQKVLEESDVSKEHNRLSLPWKLIIVDLDLTENEERWLRYDENDKQKKGMNVRVFDPDFKQYTVCLKKWKMGSKAVYCLITAWHKFVKETQLEVDDEIQLWSFRIGLNNNNNHANDEELRDNSNLCFAFIKLPKRQPEEVDEGSNIQQV